MAGESEAMRMIAERNKLMHSEESVRSGHEFVPGPTDTFITTYPKCGRWITPHDHSLPFPNPCRPRATSTTHPQNRTPPPSGPARSLA